MFKRDKKKNNFAANTSKLSNSSDVTPDILNQMLLTNMILSNTDSYSDNNSSFSDSGGSCDCGGDSGGCGGGD